MARIPMNQSVEWNVMSGFNVALASIFPIPWSIQQDCMAWRDVFNLWGGIPWIKSDDYTPGNKQQNTPLKNSGKGGRLLPFPFWGHFGPFSGASAVGRVGSKKWGLYGIPKKKIAHLHLPLEPPCQGVSANLKKNLPGFDAAKKKTSRASHFFGGGSWYLA